MSRVSTHGCLNITRDFSLHGNLLGYKLHKFVWKLLHWPLGIWSMGAYLHGSGRLPGTLQYSTWYIITQGVSGMLKKLKSLLHKKDDKNSEQLTFYQSAIYAFEVKCMHGRCGY